MIKHLTRSKVIPIYPHTFSSRWRSAVEICRDVSSPTQQSLSPLIQPHRPKNCWFCVVTSLCWTRNNQTCDPLSVRSPQTFSACLEVRQPTLHATCLITSTVADSHGRSCARDNAVRRPHSPRQQTIKSALPRLQTPDLQLTFSQEYQKYLDASTPYVPHRWGATTLILTAFFVRILTAQGWYIVAYCLGIYLLNLFLAFLQPKFDPSVNDNEGLEDGESSQNVLPTKNDEEFRPFIRRLPEFKFWHSATRAIVLSLFCSFFEIFNLPVFWPVLVMYWLILFSLTSKSSEPWQR